MNPRNLGALFCGIAAVALLVAGFMPWFTMDHGDDEDRYASSRRSWDEDEPRDELQDVRGNFGLVSGELCLRLKCKSAKYTGAKGLADDAFAWLGRATLAAALSAVALLITTALAGRTQRRPQLRGWAASVAATAAGLGAAFASTQTLDDYAGYLERGMGLGAVIIGAGLAGLGAAWPWSSPEAPPGRASTETAKRVGIALAIAGLAGVAWLTLSQHTWWRSGRTLDLLQVSPLGVEVCDDGECRLAGALGATSRLRVLACLTSLFAAALIAPAFGAASRVVRGIAPGAWAWAAAILAGAALICGVGTWASYPPSDTMTIGWGLPVFAVAMAGTGAAAATSLMFFRTRDDETETRPTAAATGGVAPGAKPVLVALGPAIPAPAAPASEPAVLSPYAPKPPPPPAAEPVSPYAPRPAAAPAPAPAPAPTPPPARPAGPSAAALMAKKTSPMCPTCRVATLWHGKRGAWWCSTCKQTV